MSARPAPSARRPVAARWLPWGLLAGALAILLAVAVGRDGGPASNVERVDALARQVRCPACAGEAVFDSDAPASRAIKEDLARRVQAGQDDTQILSYYVSRYGRSILSSPPSDGVHALVWGLPVVALVGGAAVLVVVLRRWQVAPGPAPSEEDRRLVAAALRADDGVGEGSGA